MYMYVRYKKEVLLFSDIKLHDGYKPVVGQSQSVSTIQIEPSIWFKIFAIDTVLVDCNELKVKWSRKNNVDCLSEKKRFNKPICKQIDDLELCNVLYENADFSVYETELNELFSAAQHLFCKDVNGFTVHLEDDISIIHSDVSATNTEVLRLLHCYILPMVSFAIEDETALKNAQKEIEALLEATHHEVIHLDHQLLRLENTLNRQRQDFGENFYSSDLVLLFDEYFLRLLLKHTEMDISILSAKLESFQTVVNNLKINGVVDEDTRLIEARKVRDDIYEQMSKCQMLREDLRNQMVRGRVHVKKKKSKKLDVENAVNFQKMYMEVSNDLTKKKENMHKLILRQVCISYMKEAIRMSLSDLLTSGKSTFSCGFLLHSSLFENESKPTEWKTLREMIEDVIENSESVGSHKHVSFCKIITTKIEGALTEFEMFVSRKKSQSKSGSVNDESFTKAHSPLFVENEGDNGSAIMLREPYVIVEEEDFREFREGQVEKLSSERDSIRDSFSLESIKGTIKQMIEKHFDEMCHYFLSVLPENTSKRFAPEADFEKFLWLCYEPLLFEQIGPSLIQLYERIYTNKSKLLYKKLKKCNHKDLFPDKEKFYTVLFDSLVQNSNTSKGVSDNDTFAAIPLPLNTQQQVNKHKDLKSKAKEPKTASCKGQKQMSLPNYYRESMGQSTVEDLYRRANEEKLPDVLHSIQSLEMPSSGPNSFASSVDSVEKAGKAVNNSQTANKDIFYTSLDSYQENMILSNSESADSEFAHRRLSKFQPVIKCFEDSLHEVVISRKIKEIANGLEKMDEIIQNCSVTAASADDVLELVLFLLTNMTEELFSRLHAHLNLMTDLAPKFLSSNMYVWSLAQLQMAYYYLFDQKILNMHRSSRESSELLI